VTSSARGARITIVVKACAALLVAQLLFGLVRAFLAAFGGGQLGRARA
jgi:hypothetical protein